MMNTEHKRPLVSVSCITYNHAKYIRQCLDGFIMQKTNFSFEVLIHDDASTDGTAEIIKDNEKRYPEIIKPIYEEENQWSRGRRGSAEFNFPRAVGKYIALCEGDDYWIDPNKLQKQVDFLETHPEYSMCFHNAVEHFEDGKYDDKLFSNIEDRDYSGLEIYEDWIIPTASVVLRQGILYTDLYKKILNDNLIIYGDTPLFLCCWHYGKIRGFYDVMSVYRRQKLGVTSNFNYENLAARVKHQYELASFFGEKFYKKARQRYIGMFTSAFFNTLFDKKEQTRYSFLFEPLKKYPIGTICYIISKIPKFLKLSK